MKNVTLGSELLKLRNHKGISQFKLAICMGWQGTSPIVQIEKDRRIPMAETISRLVRCLDGSFIDECRLLGLAGYLPPVPIPTLSQIQRELGLVADQIKKLRYPVYVIDNRFTYWVANAATGILVGSIEHAKELVRQRHTVLSLIFDSQLGVQRLFTKMPELYHQQIRHFRSVNVFHQHDPFFTAYPECMDSLLLAADYEFFCSIWNRTERDDYAYAQDVLGLATLALSDEISIDFQMVTTPYARLGSLFEVVYFIPVDTPDNKHIAEQVFPESVVDAPCANLWELIDAQKLLDSYLA